MLKLIFLEISYCLGILFSAIASLEPENVEVNGQDPAVAIGTFVNAKINPLDPSQSRLVVHIETSLREHGRWSFKLKEESRHQKLAIHTRHKSHKIDPQDLLEILYTQTTYFTSLNLTFKTQRNIQNSN